MELLTYWIFATIIVGLLWMIRDTNETSYWQQENWREERRQMLENFQTERHDLYDRLMAGTLPQYKEHQDDPNEVTAPIDETTTDLDEAKNEIMGVSEEDNG